MNLILRPGEFDVHKMLNEQLISSCNSPEGDMSVTNIIGIYNALLISKGHIPDFFNVKENVKEFNQDIFFQAATIEFESKFTRITSKLSGAEYSLIEKRAGQLEEDYSFAGCTQNIEYYVEHVLKANKMACLIEPDDEVFNNEVIIDMKHIKDVKIVAHDCQVVLFPEFATEIIGYGEFANYYHKPNVSSTLLLSEGIC